MIIDKLTKMSDSLWSSIPYSNVEFAISEIKIQVFPDLNLTKFQVGFGTKSIFLIKIT